LSRPTLVVISPQPAGAAAGLPTRPSSLIAAFIEASAFDEVIIVNRLRPTAFLGRVTKRRPMFAGGLAALTGRLASGARLIEHPWPFGGLERRFLQGLLGDVAKRSSGAVITWVADPKSVSAVEGDGRDRRPWRVVADIYDAWDRSPLVRGDRRRRAVTDGYRAAAADADLVFANTTSMRDRLAVLGARDARLLPNACPPLDTRPAPASGRPAGLVYVGRIHERFDVGLAVAVAAALPDTTITIAGPVEREPLDWATLAALPNVRLPGLLEPRAAREMIGAAVALIVPHAVDDYTCSQDAMKAWDAIASGTPVISTPIPPTDSWPAGLAEVCPTTESFVTAARRAVAGAGPTLPEWREKRRNLVHSSLRLCQPKLLTRLKFDGGHRPGGGPAQACYFHDGFDAPWLASCSKAVNSLPRIPGRGGNSPSPPGAL
jgi:glycosyltransferase involved in cell wall biosynthesis